MPRIERRKEEEFVIRENGSCGRSGCSSEDGTLVHSVVNFLRSLLWFHEAQLTFLTREQ